MNIRFDSRVVIVTGAGNGLGREYALWFASKGAKVVVNNIGEESAQRVVNEIKKLGGIAVANNDSVVNGEKIVKTAIDAFGRVDVVINNAGILRDVSFQKMTDKDWNQVIDVHLNGTYAVSRAAWDVMRNQGYGRIINTSSASGLYGSFGQANYSTAKLGLHGFTQTLALEGEKRNIRVNTVAPIAATRMTETVLPQEALDNLDSKYVVPVVGYLAHESCQETGQIFEIAAGYVAKLRWQRSAGTFFDLPYQAEDVKDKWELIGDFQNGVEYPTSISDTFTKVNENIERIHKNKEAAAAAAAKKVAETPTLSSLVLAPGELASDRIFTLIRVFLARGEGTHLVKQLQCIYAFNITEKKNGPIKRTFTIDLKTGSGFVALGEPKHADATFTIIDSDFEQICLGKITAQNAFMNGKLKIKGNMGSATMFTPQLFPPPTPENIAKYAEPKL